MKPIHDDNALAHFRSFLSMPALPAEQRAFVREVIAEIRRTPRRNRFMREQREQRRRQLAARCGRYLVARQERQGNTSANAAQ